MRHQAAAACARSPAADAHGSRPPTDLSGPAAGCSDRIIYCTYACILCIYIYIYIYIYLPAG